MLVRMAMAAAAMTFSLALRAKAQVLQNVPEGQRIPADEPTVAQRAREANATVQRTLHQIIPDFKLDETPMIDAVDRLRQQTGANILVNWRSLEASGIRRNAPLSLHLRDRTLARALDLILDAASPEPGRLGYVVDDGAIMISTVDDLEKNVEVRVYDVRHLLQIAPKAPRDARVAAIQHLIMDQVAPKTWRDRGGKVGAIRELEGQLIVTQTPANHRRLVKLLTGLAPLFGPMPEPPKPFPLLRPTR